MRPFTTFDGTPQHTGKVGLVKKNIWGTRNAPNTYAKELQRHLNSHEYRQIAADSSVYIRRDGKDLLIMAITIDDFCVIKKIKTFIEWTNYYNQQEVSSERTWSGHTPHPMDNQSRRQ